jgi:hypothetical protein
LTFQQRNRIREVQLITRWCSKYRWRERFAALRQRECEERIAAETKAVDAVATITEERRSRVAERAFAVAEEMIETASEILREHPTSSARLLATGVQTVALVGGAATNYNTSNVPPPVVTIVNEWKGEGPPPKPVEELSLDEIEELASQLHAKPQPLPCSDWSATDADASPVVEESTLSPDYREPEQNPDIVLGRSVPSRIARPSYDLMLRTNRKGLNSIAQPLTQCRDSRLR